MSCFYSINHNLLGLIYSDNKLAKLYDIAIERQLELLLFYILDVSFKIHKLDTRFTQAFENIRLFYQFYNATIDEAFSRSISSNLTHFKNKS